LKRECVMQQLKARIFEIKRLAIHDGDGIRTTVFFKGCPLKCVWCHNPEGISHQPQLAYYSQKCIGCMACAAVCPTGAHRDENGVHTFDRAACQGCGACADVCLGEALTFFGREVTVNELLPVLREDKEVYESSGGGVTLSGGECLVQADLCAELLKRLKEQGIHTAVDTCGFVSRETLDTFGAVSEETAAEMARGAARLCGADLAVSVTGIAGPGGGTEEKPVGTVCFGICIGGQVHTETRHFSPRGTRERIRRQASGHAMRMALDALGDRRGGK